MTEVPLRPAVLARWLAPWILALLVLGPYGALAATSLPSTGTPALPAGAPVVDLSVAFKCVTDTSLNCIERVFPGQPWMIRFGVYNQGAAAVDHWSYDIDLIDGDGVHTPLFTQVDGDPLGAGVSRTYNLPSSRRFDESEKGTTWGVEVRVKVKDPLHPEPVDRQGDNQASWFFRVENPIPDIAVSLACVTDSSFSPCRDKIGTGQPWFVSATFHNAGEVRLTQWSYDIDLVEVLTGARTPIVTQASGDSLPVDQDLTVHWPGTGPFGEPQIGSNWRIEVHASIKDPSHPEPPERRLNNQATWNFRVLNQVSDIVVQYKCVTDSTSFGCTGRVFPGAAWTIVFVASNAGEVALTSWSYDVDLIQLPSGNRTPLMTQVAGSPIPLGGAIEINAPSPHRFENAEQGEWRVELRATVKDPVHPEPLDRQANNRATWDFRVEAPVVDLVASFKCLGDSLGCRDHVFPGSPIFVHAEFFNVGEVPISNWSYDIVLINLDRGDSLTLAAQVPGDPLPRFGFVSYNWNGPALFGESDKGSHWRAVVRATIKDPLHLESPDRFFNNRATWDFQVLNPIADLRVVSLCAGDSTECGDRIHPGEPWSVHFQFYNAGEVPLTDWSYDIDLIDLQTNDRVPLATQVSGDSMAPGQYLGFSYRSPTRFDESQKGTQWRVEVRGTVKDPLHPEPADRRSDNQATWDFAVANPFSDVRVQFKCVEDTLYRTCRDRLFPGQPWRVTFGIYNLGEVPLTNWSYDIDLVDQQTNQRVPVAVQVAGDSVPRGAFASFDWVSPSVFDAGQVGTSWIAELRATVKDPLHPEPVERQFDNQGTTFFNVVSPISDIRVQYKCTTDTAGSSCRDRIFPGQPWSVAFQAGNLGDVPLANWSYDVDLVNLQSLEHIPVVTQAAGDSIGLGETRNIIISSPIVFGVDQNGTTWRVTVRATVKDPLVPEPPDRQVDNQATWDFRVEPPISDIALTSACVNHPPRGCLDRLFPGEHWTVQFSVYNQGEVALTNWSYDVDLVNLDTGQHTPLWTQVAGSLLPVRQYASYEVVSPVMFNEGQKNSHWRVDVHATVKDPLLPEPPNRQFDNQASATFRVENPLTDLAVQGVCVSDSVSYGCLQRVLVGRPWHVPFQVANLGEVPISNWSYDVDLINDRTLERIPLATQVGGNPLLPGQYGYYDAGSPVVFGEDQKDTTWRVEVRVTVKDPLHPEPADRLSNNQSSTGFRVANPLPDLVAVFKCVPDSIFGCRDRVFPGVPWRVQYTVSNIGEVTIPAWRDSIELINTDTGEHTPLVSGASSDSILPGAYLTYLVDSPMVFDERHKGSHWRVHLQVAVDDPLHPEPPDRLANNGTNWDFRVENPVTDIAFGFKCVGDSFTTCRDRVYPGEHWRLRIDAFNPGDLPLANWSYDVELVDLQSGDRTPVATQVAGDTIPVYGYRLIEFTSPQVFEESQVGRRYRVEAHATVKDPLHPEPPDRQTNNASSWEFMVVHPVSDIAILFKCVADTSFGFGCRDHLFPGQPWNVVFYASNQGDLPLTNWSYDIDLVNLDTGEHTPLKTQTAGDPLNPSSSLGVIWPSPMVFDESQKGSHWRVDVRGTVKDPLNPEPPDRQQNNVASWEFRVQNPVPNIQIGYVCVTQDSASGDSIPLCRDPIYTNLPWGIEFYVVNTGETMLDHWSFDVVLRREGIAPIPLKTQVAGPPLPPHQSAYTITWPSPRPFGADEAGLWTIEVTVAIKDTAGSDTTRRGTTNTFTVLNRIVTPTLLSLFRAEPVTEGIEVRWQFSDAHEIAAIVLERAEVVIGPWLAAGSERRVEDGATVTVDRDVEPGRTYFYRLVATTDGGRTLTFGPVTGTATAQVTEFALARLSPNPSTDAVRIDYTLPRAARVRLRILDIQGREVAVLADGVLPAGRHQATWRGDRRGEPAPAGLYFVRYETPLRNLVRRLVRIR